MLIPKLFITLNGDALSVSIFNCFDSELKDREVLDAYLARALGIRIQTRLQDIDHQKYVLTVDYALKMLNVTGVVYR